MLIMNSKSSDVPCTVQEIKSRIESNAQEQFIFWTVWAVSEIFFWSLGLDYIRSDAVTIEVKN